MSYPNIQANVNTTNEYVSKLSATSQGGAKIKSPSVYGDKLNTEVTAVQNKTREAKIQELNNKCMQVFGVGLEEVSQTQIAFLSDEQIQNLTLLMDKAVQVATKNGKLNVEQAKANFRDFATLLIGGWSCERILDDKKRQKLLSGETVSQRLDRYFDGKYSKASREEKKALLHRYVKNHFLNEVSKNKSKEEVINLQLTDYSKLLVNTDNQEDYELLQEAWSSLLAENKKSGLMAVTANIETKEEVKDFADRNTVDDLANISQADYYNKTLSKEEQTELYAMVYGLKSAENLEQHVQELAQRVPEILQKVQNQEKLTEEETKIYNAYRAMHSGQMVGTYANKNLTEEERTNLLTQEYTNIKALGQDDYNTIIGNVSKVVEDTADKFGFDVDKFNTDMDKISNNEYSQTVKAINGTDASDKLPEQEIGLKQNNNQARVKEAATNVKDTKQAIARQSTQNVATDPIIAKTDDTEEVQRAFKDVVANVVKPNVNTLHWCILQGNKNELNKKIRSLYKENAKFKQDLKEYVSNSSNRVAILKALPSDVKMDLAMLLIQENKLNERDIKNLNLDFDKTQQLQKKLETVEEKDKEKVNK